MAQSTFARSEEFNVPLLNEKMRREFWKKLFFARFTGFTTVNDNGEKIPSGAPIEILRDFAEDGSDSMLIPLLKRLNGPGVYGDNQLKGNEERQNIYYQKTYINQIRNAIKSGGRVSQLRMKKLNLAAKYRPQLEDWFAEWMEFQFHYTFHNGYSPHVMASKADGGFYIGSGQKVCHPNFYAAGSGFVTWDPDPATYEAAVENAVTGVTDTSTDHFTTSILEDLRVKVQEKNLKPMITEDGIEFYPLLAHPLQMKQLRSDTAWQSAQREVNSNQGLKNPIFSGMAGFYAGFALFERELVMAVDPDAGGSTVDFGYGTSYFGQTALADPARKVALILGSGALAHGWAAGPYIDEDDEDYKNLRGVAAGMIAGTARGEFKDDSTDGSNTDVINQSSIAVCTYSA